MAGDVGIDWTWLDMLESIGHGWRCWSRLDRAGDVGVDCAWLEMLESIGHGWRYWSRFDMAGDVLRQ